MSDRFAQVSAWWHAHVVPRLVPENGFQTAEAIGIAAVGVLVLVVVYAALSALGFDVIDWMRDQFGVGEDAATTPAGG